MTHLGRNGTTSNFIRASFEEIQKVAHTIGRAEDPDLLRHDGCHPRDIAVIAIKMGQADRAQNETGKSRCHSVDRAVMRGPIPQSTRKAASSFRMIEQFPLDPLAQYAEIHLQTSSIILIRGIDRDR